MLCQHCNTESGPSLFCYVCDAYLPSISDGVKGSLPSRFGAFLLDGLVFLTLVVLIGVVAISAGINASSFHEGGGLAIFLIVFLGGWFGYLLLSLWLLARGQTPGKWLMDIRAVDKRNGSSPGLGRVLFRETFGKWVSGCFLGLGWFWAIWDPNAQAWHDKISGTVVLYRRTQSRKLLCLGILPGALILSVGLAWVTIIEYPPEAQLVATEGGFTGDFSVARAFTALFDNYDTLSQSSSATGIEGRYDNASHAGTLTLLLDIPFSQVNVQKHLLVTSTTVEGETSHADGARIGAYVFAKQGRRWILQIADKEIDQFGAFGHAFGIADNGHPNGTDGQAQEVKFGPDVYGFSLTITDGGQGIEQQNRLFVAPMENHYRPVLTEDVEGDNGGQCGPSGIFHSPCYEYHSTVRFLDSIHAGFFDIEVDEVGTQDSDQGVIPANEKKIYFFSGDKYQLTSQPDGNVRGEQLTNRSAAFASGTNSSGGSPSAP